MIERRAEVLPADPRCVDPAPVRRRIAEVHARFYDGALGGLPLDGDAVPFLVRRPEGTTDRFTLDIDYTRYPVMFGDAFPGVSNEALADLCVVAQLFAEALVGMDKVLDRQIRSDSQLLEAIALLGGQYKLMAALRVLHRLFGAERPFWRCFERLHAAFVASVVREKLAGGVEEASIAAMERMAVGKVGMAKIITAALADLSGRADLLPAAEASQDLYAVGYQLYDDVKDWRVDYERAQYSFLLRRALRELGLEEAVAAGRRPPPDELGRRLHASDVLQDTLALGAGYLRRAREAAAPLRCRAWVSWIQTMEERLLLLRADLVELRRRAVERARVRGAPRVRLGIVASPLEHVAGAVRRGIVFLQDQERKDYLEGAHLEMVPPAVARGPGRSACRFGTVFQRAIVLHALGLAGRAGFALDEAVLRKGLEGLVGARLRDRRGGWSYFPDMLPPDCDDLAEVLHVLLAVGDPRTVELCRDPIRLAVRSQRADGGIDTWIADPDDPCSVRLKAATVAVWGAGPDVEVMANLLHGLWLYAPAELAGPIARGASYVAARQDGTGSWASTWYAGPYYGTWACSRLLDALGGWEEALRRAEAFLLDSQSASGGFGPDGSALDTSFALMTVVGRRGRPRSRVEPAVRVLLEGQRESGAWDGTPFIKMDTARRTVAPMPGFQETFHTSDTLATAAAVRALLAVTGRDA